MAEGSSKNKQEGLELVQVGEYEAVTHKAPCREDTTFHTILGPRPFTLAQEKLACGGGEHLPEGEGGICRGFIAGSTSGLRGVERGR